MNQSLAKLITQLDSQVSDARPLRKRVYSKPLYLFQFSLKPSAPKPEFILDHLMESEGRKVISLIAKYVFHYLKGLQQERGTALPCLLSPGMVNHASK